VNDHQLAAQLAAEAGRLLLGVREELADAPQAERKAAGDKRSDDYLMTALGAERPDDAVLSEEGADDPVRLQAERVWIVDPLDGTREFSEPDRDDWAVHVALWEDGELSAGAVALPARGVVLGSDRPTARPVGVPGRIRIAVSRTRPPTFVAALAQRLGAELVPMGSAGVKATAVLTDQADADLHAGGQYEWDSAAPAVVCRASGLWTSRLDGSPLRYNPPAPRLPDLLICRPEIADLNLAEVGADLEVH
jgi:3'(2'), 5'-bisphosphate nucleotidase